MKIKFSFLAVFLLFWLPHANAQKETKGFLKGRVADTTTHQVLKQSTSAFSMQMTLLFSLMT